MKIEVASKRAPTERFFTEGHADLLRVRKCALLT